MMTGHSEAEDNHKPRWGERDLWWGYFGLVVDLQGRKLQYLYIYTPYKVLKSFKHHASWGTWTKIWDTSPFVEWVGPLCTCALCEGGVAIGSVLQVHS